MKTLNILRGGENSVTTDNMGMKEWTNSEVVQPEELNENFRDIDKEFTQRGFNIQWKGADPTGVRSSSEALIAALAEDTDSIIIPQGVYLLKTSVTVPDNKELIFGHHARLKPALNRTIEINGLITASPNDWLFDTTAGGTVSGNMKCAMLYPRWFGADDTAAMQKALGSSSSTKIPLQLNENVTITKTLTLGSGVKVLAYGNRKITNTNASISGEVRINDSDIEIDHVELDGGSVQCVFFTGNPKRVRLARIKIQTAGHGVQLNTSNAENVVLIESDIDADQYGVLINSGAKTGKNMKILFNNIYSRTADAIELNTPTANAGLQYDNFKQVFIIGNRLCADEQGTSSSSGFAIGIANTHDVIVTGNISEKSRLEAVHIEGNQENIIITGNVFNECIGDGVRIQNSSWARPPLVTNNIFIQQNMSQSGNGIHRLYDPKGHLECNFANNYIRGFNKGYWIDGSSSCNVQGSFVEDCKVGVYAGVSGKVHGSLFVKNCSTLASAQSGALIERIVSLSVPTNVLTYSGTSGYLGATLQSLTAFTAPISTSINSFKRIDLFPMPSLLSVKLTCRVRSGSSKLMLTADVSWDGSQLNVANLLVRQAGSILIGYAGEPPFVHNNGQLALNIYTVRSLSQVMTNYDFTGTYYVD